MKDSIEFLTQIYNQQCELGDYVILVAKGPGFWKDISIRFDKRFLERLKEFFSNYPPSKYDLYWSPMPYSQPHRRKQYSLDTKFLAQDIDETPYPEKLNPPPSYIWESSPNKYQGLWELDRYIDEEEYTPLNKSLAKFIGCDDCFDFTHVYRIPGTVNHKYKNHPKVKEAKALNTLYKPKKLKALLGTPREEKPPKEKKVSQLQGGDITERKIFAKYSIPKKVKDLLALDSLGGIDRSGTIWFVENKLHELGMSPQEIIYLIKNSVFNKYRGRSDEDTRLQQELEKIIEGSISPEENSLNELRVSTFEEVMGNSSTFEGWLVKGFWGRRSHGIVAGMPKCFKSTLVYDLVISVASGEPFLGRFPVLDPGPVLVIQNENADYIMKDRTEKVILDRGLVGRVKSRGRSRLNLEFPPNLPITFLNQQGFTLSNEEHRAQIEKLISELSPVLVVFDPLYLMFDGDLNSSKELNPILNWLLSLKNKYKTSVMVIHHYNKGNQQTSLKGGARMAGSIMLYGWVESAWYLTKEDEEEPPSPGSVDISNASGSSTVTLSREFRMAGSYPDLDIHFEMGEIGDPLYGVEVTAVGSSRVTIKTLEDEILLLLGESNTAVSKRAIIENLGVDIRVAKKALEELLKNKKIVAINGGYSISKN